MRTTQNGLWALDIQIKWPDGHQAKEIYVEYLFERVNDYEKFVTEHTHTDTKCFEKTSYTLLFYPLLQLTS
jgi:hypothetical protein